MGPHVYIHEPPGTPDANTVQVSVFWMLLTSAPGAQRVVLTLEMPLSDSPHIAESKPDSTLNDTNLQLDDQLPPVAFINIGY